MSSHNYSALEPKPLAFASLAGFLTWVLLNRRPVRGDYAVVFYTVVFATAFFITSRSAAVESPFLFCTTLSVYYAISALLSTALYRLSPFHPLAGYPGPRTWWISSLKLSYVSYKGRRHFILHDLHDKYGPFIRIGPNTLSINSPSANAIYSASHSMAKSDSYLTPGHLGLVALFFKQKTKELHSNRKKIWSNAFTGASVFNFFPALERRTWQLLQCVERRQNADGLVELSDCFCHWAYDLMGEMVFGGCNNLELMLHGDPRNLIGGGKKATIILDSIGQSPWLMDIIWHLPAGGDMHKLRKVAMEMMRTRVAADKDVQTRDLSSYLLAGNQQTGEQISLPDLELEAVVAIQGGSDNTSTTLCLAFYFLLSRPPYYKTLQAEIDEAFPDRTGHLDNNKLQNLPFLNAVINEALRLGSPFFLPRVVQEGGVTIDGKFIPQDTIVAIAAYSQQISPENFPPDPLVFRPERWFDINKGTTQSANKGTLYSFSSGPHVCVAKSFAYQEMRHAMARLLLTFDMTLPESFDIPGYRDNILNMRTTILERPLMVKAVRRPNLNIDAFI